MDPFHHHHHHHHQSPPYDHQQQPPPPHQTAPYPHLVPPSGEEVPYPHLVPASHQQAPYSGHSQPGVPAHQASHHHHYGAPEASSFEAAGKYGQPSLQLPQGKLVKIFPKSDRSFSLAIRSGGVVMDLANSNDDSQMWIKDDSYGFRVKDKYSSPGFALVNKETGKVLKHAKEKGQQVLLEDYRPGMIGDDILWTESQDFGEGYKTIRCATDTLLNLSIFQGEKNGGLRNGSPVILDTWHKYDSQLWKIFPLFSAEASPE